MSSNKYTGLPDIDTAPDVYETEDVFPSSQADKDNSSDEDSALPARHAQRGKTGDVNGKEELDSSHLIGAEEATKRFRRAERKRGQSRTQYAYPPSPTTPTDSSKPKTAPISQRLRALQAELSALEVELSDPSNPQLHKEVVEENVDPGELIRGLVDVRGRLERIRKEKEGRGRLVGIVLGEGESVVQRDGAASPGQVDNTKYKEDKADMRTIAEMDKRVGELEKLVGSSSIALDETSPLPPPLLPLITRLNAQMTLLTQPRHIDSISRRLKLLISDLDRASASQHAQRRHASQHPATPSSQVQEQLLPLLTRLGPSLPHIPHILTRLRTLSALHTAASEFHDTLESLEAEQKAVQQSLNDLEEAIQTVEKSLDENQAVVKGNVIGLESRINALTQKLEGLDKAESSKSIQS